MQAVEPPSPSPQDNLQALSIRDVAKRLAVSERHLHRLVARGDIPTFLVGRRRLIGYAALAKWLAGKNA